jgi:hypothetical protein
VRRSNAVGKMAMSLLGGYRPDPQMIGRVLSRTRNRRVRLAANPGSAAVVLPLLACSRLT